MKTLVLYRLHSDHGRDVEGFIEDLKKSGASIKVEVMNVDTREGMSTASLYDVTRYPAIMVLRDDGILQKLWEGVPLPMINEVEAYLTA